MKVVGLRRDGHRAAGIFAVVIAGANGPIRIIQRGGYANALAAG
jgi:hypothetical protein